MKTLLTVTLAAAFLAAPAIAQDSLISLDSPMDATVISMQWVKPDASGAITGTVVVPGANSADLSGELFLAGQQGEPMRVPVSPGGNFALQGVPAGVYTLVYQAPQAFGAYALQVVSASSDAKLSNKTVISAAAIDPQMALTAVAKYQPTEEGVDVQINGIRTSVGFGGLETGFEPMDIAQVAQTASGGMRGKMIRAGSVENGLLPATDMNVMVMQNGQSVDKTVTVGDGSFSFENLAIGNYQLVASGSSGFAVIGFQLVEGPEVLTSAMVSNVAASAPRQGVASTLVVQVAEPDPNLMGANPGSIGPNGEPNDIPRPLGSDPFVAGGPGGGGFAGGGGGSFGGGGGGGGGLGAGGLAGLAALGAVLAVTLSDDDNNNNFVPAPSSPSIP